MYGLNLPDMSYNLFFFTGRVRTVLRLAFGGNSNFKVTYGIIKHHGHH